MTIYDISLPVSPALPVWPGDPAAEIHSLASVEEGDMVNLSHLRLSTHTGTHVDAPLHLLKGGRPVDQISLDVLIGDATVVRLPAPVTSITAGTLETAGIPPGTTRLLLATGNSDLWEEPFSDFRDDYVALDVSAAEWIVEHGILLVGVDYLSVEQAGSLDLPVHRTLLEAEVTIVEGLDLRGVPEGQYRLVCLPLRLLGADGAPARAVLLPG